ncbi:MAG TPA: hypothetical protein VEE84_06275, partial [Burkholderiaceae bacterium]|nr:hypothetical protein [Burkholderiaceae bacterium]
RLLQLRSPLPMSPRGHASAFAACALLALALLLGTSALRAQTSSATRPQLSYTCTTKSGHNIRGDLPPPECKDRDVRVLNPDGSLKEIIPAPLTTEQRKKRREEEETQRKEEEAERTQAQKDRSLLETYGTIEEIDAARDRAIAGRQGLITRAEQRIAQFTRERKRLDDEAEFYAKRELPADLKQAYESNASLTKQQEKTRADAEHEIEQIKERFAAERQRYLELEEMSAKAAQARERKEREAEAQQSREE